jgi:hypothetical protein
MERCPSNAAIASRLIPRLIAWVASVCPELVRVHVTDPGTFGDGFDVAVDGAPVEGMTVVAFNEPTRP